MFYLKRFLWTREGGMNWIRTAGCLFFLVAGLRLGEAWLQWAPNLSMALGFFGLGPLSERAKEKQVVWLRQNMIRYIAGLVLVIVGFLLHLSNRFF